jgi:hypothetical protein
VIETLTMSFAFISVTEEQEKMKSPSIGGSKSRSSE